MPFLHNKTWFQVRKGKIVRSRCDDILAGDKHKFQTVTIRDPRNFSSDHYMLVAEYYQRVFGTELPESVVAKG